MIQAMALNYCAINNVRPLEERLTPFLDLWLPAHTPLIQRGNRPIPRPSGIESDPRTCFAVGTCFRAIDQGRQRQETAATLLRARMRTR